MKTVKSEDKNSKPEVQRLTRRQWILGLGGGAVVLGFRGAAREAAVEGALGSVKARGLALPPGLYEASNDHLRHALSSDSRFYPIPPGSEVDFVRPRSAPYEPQAFTREEFLKIRRIVALLLGETAERLEPPATGNASGESVVDEVGEWVDHVAFHAGRVRETVRRLAPEYRTLAIRAFGQKHVERMETDDPQKISREGLEWLENESVRQFNKKFLSLGEEQQTELLRSISDERPDMSSQNAGTRFFDRLKAEVIRGFYTSQAGLKELDYKGNTFYGESPACARHDHSDVIGEARKSSPDTES